MAAVGAANSTRVSAGSTLGEGRYAVTRLLGEGSQGQTLEAIDKRDGSLVAIKRFSVRGAASWKDVELAEREARVLAQLDHPALPSHLGQFEEDGALLLVMSLVEGETLAAKRERGQLITTVEVMQLLWQLGGVLTYLHNRAPPVVHRDIKPRNIIQRPDGSFALVDFGSVRDRLKADGSTVVGTFGFMAPEQFQGRALPVTDVYGLGATALVLLTGTAPEDQPHQGLAIDVKAALGAGADPRVVQLLSSMLRPDPDQRLVDVQPALEQIFQQSPEFFSGVAASPGSARRGSPAAGSARASQEQSQAQRPSNPGQQRSDGSARQAHPPSDDSHQGSDADHSSPSETGSRARGSEFWGGPLLVLIVVLGLWVARVATWALMRFALPMLLVVLSLVFGNALRRAAERVRGVGKRGDDGLRWASHRVRGASSAAAARQRESSRSASPPPPDQAGSGKSERRASRAERVRVDAWPDRRSERDKPRGKSRVIDTELEELDGDDAPNASASQRQSQKRR